MELLTLDADTGSVPRSRLSNARDAYAIYDAFRAADMSAASDRARVQDMLDGAPPIPPSELRAANQTYRANLNWGEALADHESALAAYNDLVAGVDRLANIETTHGSESERSEWQEIIGEGFHHLLMNWDEFHFNRQLLAHYFVSQGLGVLNYIDNRNWQFQVSSIGDFLIPRDAWACDSKVDIAIARRSYTVGELWRFIRNERAASRMGWNVPAVKDALKKAGNGSNKDVDWEERQRAFKTNDLYESYAKSPRIRVLHYYVREFNGSYSHHIGLRDGSAEDFLYTHVSRFARANEAFIIFPFGIGTNGAFHSIRGLTHKNFPFIQSANRLRNAALDGALLRSMVLLKPTGELDKKKLAMAYAGPLGMLPSNTDVVTAQLPNIANEILPVIREMAVLRKENNGGYLTHSLSPEGGDRTAYEIQAQIAQNNILTSASLDLFSQPWGKMLN